MGSDTCKLRRFESPIRIDIGVSWREIDEARAETENINEEKDENGEEISEHIVHAQDMIADSCLEYKPTSDYILARQDDTGRGMAWPGAARQDKDVKMNLKEVGEKTEDYFKRVNVFSLVNVRPASAGHGVARQNPTRPGRTRQDKELNNEDL